MSVCVLATVHQRSVWAGGAVGVVWAFPEKLSPDTFFGRDVASPPAYRLARAALLALPLLIVLVALVRRRN